MAIKFPDKQYLTVGELLSRWECTIDDVYQQVLGCKLAPSIYVMGPCSAVFFAEGIANACGHKYVLQAKLDSSGEVVKRWVKGFFYLPMPQRLPGGRTISIHSFCAKSRELILMIRISKSLLLMMLIL